MDNKCLKWPCKKLVSSSQILIEKEAYCVTPSARPLLLSEVDCIVLYTQTFKKKNVDLTDTHSNLKFVEKIVMICRDMCSSERKDNRT